MNDRPAFDLIRRPLERQIKGINVAVRAGSTERTWLHARSAVALINEATDLALRPDDLLQALLEGAEAGRNGQQVIDALLELGVQRRLIERGTLVMEDGVGRFTRDGEELRAEVRSLLGAHAETSIDRDPRWRDLLAP